MKRIIFESAPEFILLCIVAGMAYASVQYFKTSHPWNRRVNAVLFTMRFVLSFFVAFLLLGPIIKQINNLFEKPLFLILQDNSASIKAAVNPSALRTLNTQVLATKKQLEEKGFQSEIQNLDGKTIANDSLEFTASVSDLNSALKKISNRYEGKNIAGVLLVSDGLYNAGLSPLYANYNFPIYSIGIGDTSERMDIGIRNIAYNKIAYQGNKFPLRVEIQAKNLGAQPVTVSLLKGGRVIEKQTKDASDDQLLTYDFQPLANDQGIQKYDVEVDINPNEYNTRNNRSSVFVEIVEGKKKILLVASSPHPDIKTIREVVEKNSNYEFLLHIPAISEQQQSVLQPDKVDLVIFHQSPDLRGRTSALFQTFSNSKTSLLLILGQQSDLSQIAKQNMPVRFDSSPRDYDEVTPVTNPGFSNFSLSAETNTLIAQYPPVSVHYGKFQIPQTSTALIFQKVGSVSTEKPLLSVDVKDSRKIGVMLGEGLWRWRLNEFDRTEGTSAFDEVFGKLIQFLSTTDDKRKFRSYPLQQEFSETEPVIFESQVYNDIYEPVYGNSIEIELTRDNGSKTQYSYVTSPGNIRYQIGGLKEGVYRYRARTVINDKIEEVRGEFAVVERQIELQNLTADFDLLRKLSSASGGRFFTMNDTQAMTQFMDKTQAKSIIHSEETYDSIINLKWLFWILLLLVSAEWGLRKYYGSY